MTFQSILFEALLPAAEGVRTDVPACFRYLNLDQVVDAVTVDWKEYDLAPFFYTRLRDLRAIAYRQEIFRDLANEPLMLVVKAFSEKMRALRACLRQAEQFRDYKYARDRRYLEAVDSYCKAVERLMEDLGGIGLKSKGFCAFRDYLAGYVASGPFRGISAEAAKLKSHLSTIRFSLQIREGAITVRDDTGESDYSTEVEETFQKFRSGAAITGEVNIPQWDGMNQIEAQIQDRVALLHPETFRAMESFCSAHADFLDATISGFDREIQFYAAYLAHIEKFLAAGLPFCEPRLSAESKEVEARDSFDLALAAQLIKGKAAVVCNHFFLHGAERILVVSGPNQGGKTTFARMFGQLHYLASLGCPVPGGQGRLFL
ncbi:MAG: MutS-related protein [Bryobacteraceae bacterium]